MKLKVVRGIEVLGTPPSPAVSPGEGMEAKDRLRPPLTGVSVARTVISGAAAGKTLSLAQS
jgi:hypothetical protein